ncbi:glycine--tRNA ligase [Candidatus Wolfebacteria bacterium]|nr:glycine--tRNA ligase [Candidatus Wolfebacteria bacterium]
MNDLMNKIISLCKRRGFIYPGSEIYGGLANSWDYGPLGVELKNNIKQLWWKRFVQERDDVVGIDAALIMNPKVWEASGHLKEFSDPLVECKKCHNRFRTDQIDKNKCPDCGGELTDPKQFNLMFKTFIGPAEEKANIAYFRPETAQSMFVNFKNVLTTSRKNIPFGIAQIGKAFRNEITPGNFIFRTREFEQMEIEYFIRENEWKTQFEYWRNEMISWIKELGIDVKKIHEAEIPEGERAHYSKRTIDFEYEFPFGRKELYGLAYRADFDLKNHEKFSGQNLKYKDSNPPAGGGEEFWPHVIEPTWGVDRSVLTVLLEAYREEKDPAKNGASRIILKLPPKLAPYKAAVFPLLANKPQLIKKAKEIYKMLKFPISDYQLPITVAWDDRGNIGKRYYSQDEIGTPFCVTVDFETLEDNAVTVRDRDTTQQKRIKINDLINFLKSAI